MRDYDFSGISPGPCDQFSPYMDALQIMKQALNGETEDQMFYMWLISRAPNRNGC